MVFSNNLLNIMYLYAVRKAFFFFCYYALRKLRGMQTCHFDK